MKGKKEYEEKCDNKIIDKIIEEEEMEKIKLLLTVLASNGESSNNHLSCNSVWPWSQQESINSPLDEELPAFSNAFKKSSLKPENRHQDNKPNFQKPVLIVTDLVPRYIAMVFYILEELYS